MQWGALVNRQNSQALGWFLPARPTRAHLGGRVPEAPGFHLAHPFGRARRGVVCPTAPVRQPPHFCPTAAPLALPLVLRQPFSQ